MNIITHLLEEAKDGKIEASTERKFMDLIQMDRLTIKQIHYGEAIIARTNQTAAQDARPEAGWDRNIIGTIKDWSGEHGSDEWWALCKTFNKAKHEGRLSAKQISYGESLLSKVAKKAAKVAA